MRDRASVDSWPFPEEPKHAKQASTTTTSSTDGPLPWADEPFALIQTPAAKLRGSIHHPAAHIANESAHLFNAMLRGLNAIYQQAPYIQKPVDIIDFSFLVHSWAAWVIHHMELCTESLFPSLEAALYKPETPHGTDSRKPLHLTATILDEQAGFVPILRQILSLAERTHLEPGTYDNNELMGLLADLGPPMQAHMAEQVNIVFLETVLVVCGQPGTVAGRVTGDRILQCWQACEAQSGRAMDRTVIPPMMVRCRDVTYETGHDWPGLPVAQVHAIADKLSVSHAGAWRFLPCNVWGKPVELYALVVDGRWSGSRVEPKGKGKEKAKAEPASFR